MKQSRRWRRRICQLLPVQSVITCCPQVNRSVISFSHVTAERQTHQTDPDDLFSLNIRAQIKVVSSL